jgi:ABC-2 type transport system ATP-binding protein
MDDLEALCSEVTILAAGRVVFSGPLKRLSAENRELDYRLRASDPSAARGVAAEAPGISVIEGSDGATRPDTDVIVVRAQLAALDQLVARIVRADIAVREWAPVVSPLEAAFLALTEQEQRDQHEQHDHQKAGR